MRGLAQSPGLSLHAGQGAGKSGDKEAGLLPRQSRKGDGAQSRCQPSGPHSARVSEAGHQPAMPASQSVWPGGCPPCSRELRQPCCSNPPSEGQQSGTPSLSPLSLPLSHPHPEGAQLEVTSPLGAPQTATATALLENRDPWGLHQTCSRALSPLRPHAWWETAWCAQHCQKTPLYKKTEALRWG